MIKKIILLFLVVVGVTYLFFLASNNFACGNDVEHKGKIYSTLKIGEQCWLAENINVGECINCDDTDGTRIEKRCYDNEPNNCAVYGGLYTWDSANKKGVCPKGWHLPSYEEWKELEVFLGVYNEKKEEVAHELRDDQLWDGSNSSQFSALPGGWWNKAGFFIGIDSLGFWWSSTSLSEDTAYRFPAIPLNSTAKHREYSVRCINS